MQNPFAIAVQWPDDFRRYLVHLQRPYFTAALVETAAATWLLVSWAPGASGPDRARIFRAATEFCRSELDQAHVPIEFVERKNGFHLPRYLMAQTLEKELFIVEPDYSAPLVEVRESAFNDNGSKSRLSTRFDAVTQWRLGEMRKYYRQYLERQKPVSAPATPAPSATPK